MTEEQKPVGQLFSRAYLQPIETVRDSDKMRVRVLRTILRVVPENRRDVGFGRFVEERLGIKFVSSHGYSPRNVDWERLVCSDLSITDLLDVLTLLWRRLGEHGNGRERFHLAIALAFEEEAIGFSIDKEMGFHPAFDKEFERSRSSIVRILNGERFLHEADFIEKSEAALLANPVDGRAAIQAVYDATENLFKRLTGKQNIANVHVRQELSQIALQGVPEDGKSNVAVKKMLDAFEDWAAACHFYRHAPGEADSAQPSIGISILIVSQGYGFVRWLAEMVPKQVE